MPPGATTIAGCFDLGRILSPGCLMGLGQVSGGMSMRITEISKALLQSENPEELKRLQEEGALQEILENVEAFYSEHEEATIRQLHRDIEKENLSYQEEVGRKNMAAMCAREITTNDIEEFWKGGK
jgi:hypothetical protein